MGLFKKLFHSEYVEEPNTFEKSSEFASLAGRINGEDDEEEIEEQEMLEGITDDVDDLDDYDC